MADTPRLLPPPSAVIFDLDGTLVDTSRDLVKAVNQTRADFDLAPLELETILAMVGNGSRYLVRRALGEAASQIFEVAFPRFLGHYRACCLETTRPYPGIPELLKELTRRYPVGLLTNKRQETTDLILESFNLQIHFGAVVAGDTLATHKPDPEGLLFLARSLDVAVGEMILVGDNSVDACTAKAGGCRIALVEWGFTSPELLREWPADIRAADVLSLRAALLHP